MAFLVNEKLFQTMTAVAKELGKSRVYRKDFERFGIVEVADDYKVEAPAAETTETEVTNEEPTVKADNPFQLDYLDFLEDDGEDEPAGEPVEEPEAEPEAEPAEPVEEPEAAADEKSKKKRERKNRREKKERVITEDELKKAAELQETTGFTDIWDWAVTMKKTSVDDVVALAKSMELTWDEHPTPKVNRMRVVATIREALFPGQKRPRVRKSVWEGVPTEDIMAIADENGVEFEKFENQSVQRMQLVKALKKAGILAPEK